MKDKLLRKVDLYFLGIYRLVMWMVYQYKTFIFCRGVKDISPEYKAAIRRYWRKYYKHISIQDFKWFYTKTKLKNVRFIPDVVFHSKIEPYFNDIKTMDAYSNKCYYKLLFQGYRVPYTLVHNINGVYTDGNYRIINLDEVIKICQQEEEIIIKPAIQSGGGRNITVLKMEQDIGLRLEATLEDYQRDFVIQRLVVQHKELSKMNPTSLNTLRVQTFLYKGEVYVLSALLRVGIMGSRVDNVSNGGLGISVNGEGVLHNFAFDKNGTKFYCHPNGYIFKGRKMPSYDKIVRCVKELHPRFAKFGFIGWDIAVDESGEPVIIEFNLNDTSVRAPQLNNGPLFKGLTDEVLDEVFKKKKTQRKKIKLLIISTVGLNLYGVTNSIMNYYRSMDKSDLQIHFVVTHKVPRRLKEEIYHSGGKIYELASRYRHPLMYMLQLFRTLKTGQYDIVHAHGNSATLGLEMGISRLCKVRTRIAHCHNSTCDHYILHRILKPIFLRCYTKGFACSEQAGRWLFGNREFTVIHNGIPLSDFEYNPMIRDQFRKRLGYRDNKVIGHIGHFTYQKNQGFLIKLFAEIYKRDPSYRLLLIGDGEQMDTIKKQVMEMGLDEVVCFYGETLKVAKLLQAMDIFVFPSNFEGLGMALIEAQAAGLPCVASDAVPVEAKITPHFAYLSLTDSQERWIENILEFGRLDRKVYGEQVIEIIKESNFNIKKEAEKLKKLYHNYVSEN